MDSIRKSNQKKLVISRIENASRGVYLSFYVQLMTDKHEVVQLSTVLDNLSFLLQRQIQDQHPSKIKTETKTNKKKDGQSDTDGHSHHITTVVNPTTTTSEHEYESESNRKNEEYVSPHAFLEGRS
jgi:hypothetical protein